ncbi:MAG: hypothetical protein K2H64_09760, partial [Desulfovibrio sp.]|nr:hypothetical protein [Desulfovibrio sp.]
MLEKLEDFARIGTPLDESVLTGQTWEQLRRTRYERLKNETENFLRQSVSGKTKYQPATFARRNLFGEAGELGKILMECVRNKPRDLEEKIRFLNDPKNRDSMIERNQPRAYTKEIKAKARQKLLSDMDECERLMREWLDYYADVRKVVSGSYQEKSFKEICDGDLSGKIAAVPEGAWLATELARLRSREAPEDLRHSDDSLSLWPMTMVSAIPAGENIFSPAALVAELLEDKYGADETRAANAAIQLARGYIAQFNKLAESWPELLSMEPPREIIAASLPDLGQAGAFSFDELAEISKERWNEFFEAEFNAIQEYISDCYFRGAIIDKKQNDANAKLNGLRARANGDTDSVYLTEKLRLLRRELEDSDDSMLEEVERRLEKLRSEAGREDIGEYVDRTLAEVRHSRAYSAALDALARMEDYLTSGKGPAPSPVVAERKKESAARDFYEKLENGQISETAYGPNEWRDAVSLRNSRLDSGFNRIITKLIRWFGFQLERAEQSAVIFRGGAPFYWHIMEYKMTINSPMPLWGSQSRGRHVLVFGWGRVSPADIDRIMTSGNIRENMAATLFCFCPLSVRDREQILKASVKWPVFPLIVDSNLFNYLVARDEGDRTRAFFEIALAGARYNPYTPDAFGAVAKEMFVGRAAERETVMNPTGACIIYGGRQLGKSALLQQVYNDYKDNVTTVVVSVILGKSESSLLDKLIKECVSRKIVPPQTTRNTFQQNVQKWLDEDDARRLVALLDECDNALEKDEARSFEEIEVFRNLMQTSERRFKAVFTGLHSVQRFGHFPNSPIYHLGDPVCVGPLERDAARELMEDRMSILGFGFESPQLPLMALNYCSYQPKLIQMFCSELITALQKNPDRPLLANITRAEMLAVYESHNLKKKIQECFTMTLDLDPRYFVIAYAMALYGVEGAAIDDLWEELKDYWPAAFKNCNLQTIRGLLHEMEGLGLVISLGGAYRLRAPHIIELLGGEENILLELSQKAGQDYTPPNDPDQLRIKGADIFVATQYNMLADKTSALYWVTGSKALGLDKTPEALEKIAGQNESGLSIACGRIEGASAEEAIKNLGRMYDKIRSGGLLAWISSEQLKDPGRFLPEAEKWLQKLRSDKKFVKIVFLVQPRDQYDFIRENIADKYSSYEIRLTPWSRTGIEDRCREESLPIKRAAELDDQTGGWHCVMPGNFSQDAADATAVAELTREILNEIPGLDEISGQFGIL